MELSKRELIAAMAMQGILSRPDWCANIQKNADEAVRQADALIAELSNNPSTPTA